jgi:hypothetical protein
MEGWRVFNQKNSSKLGFRVSTLEGGVHLEQNLKHMLKPEVK